MATKATTLWALATVRSWLGATAPASKSVTSITRSGSTATVTCTAHGYSTGDSVAIAGAGEAEYNGTFVITNTGANTFTFTVGGTPTSPATGTITATGPETADDTDMTRVADAASEFIERYTKRKYVNQTITEILDSELGQNQIFLAHYPVNTVTSVTVRWSPTDSTPETLSTDTYRTFLKQGRIWVHSFRMPKTIGGVTVVYNAGYATQDHADLPQAIVTMGLELCKVIYTEHKTGSVGAQSVSLGAQTFIIKPEWPKQIKQTLDDWRRVV